MGPIVVGVPTTVGIPDAFFLTEEEVANVCESQVNLT